MFAQHEIRDTACTMKVQDRHGFEGMLLRYICLVSADSGAIWDIFGVINRNELCVVAGLGNRFNGVLSSLGQLLGDIVSLINRRISKRVL